MSAAPSITDHAARRCLRRVLRRQRKTPENLAAARLWLERAWARGQDAEIADPAHRVYQQCRYGADHQVAYRLYDGWTIVCVDGEVVTVHGNDWDAWVVKEMQNNHG